MALTYIPIGKIDSKNPFFDSLREDYPGFDEWLARKSNENAYTLEEEGKLLGFLYLKVEQEPVLDIEPALTTPVTRIKIGTLKVEAHGTRLGERLLKKAFDYAVIKNAEEIYVSVFEKHEALLQMFEFYGFERHGTKTSSAGIELVLKKRFSKLVNRPMADYPTVVAKGVKKYLFSIYPKWHTQLFPDSILKTETYDLIKDISHTNSIHKVYIAKMKNISVVRPNDLLLIYRTSDQDGKAWYRSVVTSICTVREVYPTSRFTVSEFIKYCARFSVFTEKDLRYWHAQPNAYVFKLLYNAALAKRLTRGNLVENCGLDDKDYWGFREITDNQFKEILTRGGVNEDFVVY